MTKRGLVVTPRFSFDGRRLEVRSIETVHPLVRRGVLYWDQVDLPDNNLIHHSLTTELAELAAAGVLSRTRVTLPFSRGFEAAFVHAQFEAFNRLDQSEPGVWAMAQEAMALHIPIEYEIEARTLQVELCSTLPVPDGAVPIDRILRFKESRRDELQALRTALDDMYSEVLLSEDVPHAKNVAMDKVEAGVRDVWRSMSESFATKILRSMKVEINPGAAVAAFFGAGALGTAIGINPFAVGAVLAGASMIKFEKGVGRVSRAARLGPFAYVQGVLEELAR